MPKLRATTCETCEGTCVVENLRAPNGWERCPDCEGHGYSEVRCPKCSDRVNDEGQHEGAVLVSERVLLADKSRTAAAIALADQVSGRRMLVTEVSPITAYRKACAELQAAQVELFNYRKDACKGQEHA